MISIPIQIDVVNGTAPFTFNFKTTDNATFSNVSGVATLIGNTYTVKTNVLYSSADDINKGIISLEVVDANGCLQVLSPVVINNPCNLQGNISSNGEFVFVAAVTGGSGQYSFNWNYSPQVFKTVDNNLTDNILSLAIAGGYVPNSTVISCTVTDTIYGCTLNMTFSYSFCKPLAGDITVPMTCNVLPVSGCGLSVKTQYYNLDIKSAIRLCPGQIIDWTNMEFSALPTMCVINNNDGTITIASSEATQKTINLLYNVATINGIKSNWGTLSIVIPECADTKDVPLTATPVTIQLTVNDSVSDVKTIPLEQRVGGTPVWNSFQFTNTPTFGTISLSPNKEILYTITDITTTPSIPDTIKWTLQDNKGNQINITDTVLRDAIPLPVTVTDTVCAKCNTTTDPVDVLANDTGDIDRSTLTITLNDPDIVITKNSDNNLIFTALPGASFANLNRYIVANTQGAFTPEHGFIVQVACAGSNKNITKNLTCSISKTFNIFNEFTNVNAFNVSYAEVGTAYTTAGGTITGGLGTVNFAAIPFGTYIFEMTAGNVVACSPTFDDKGYLTVIHAATPFITIGTPVVVTTGVYSIPFTYSGIISPFTVLNNGAAANFHTGITANGGTGVFVLFATSGDVITISAVTECGAVVNSNVTLT